MTVMVRPRAVRSSALRLAVAGCALLVVLAGCSRSARSAAPAQAASGGGSTFTLMQMNLCLSGLAGCYAKVAYPDAVDEAAALIRAARPDAVTVSEACGGDTARIARLTGYHLRFSTVIYGGAPFRCIRPRGRGRFGDAVLTEARIVRAANHAFAAQTDKERRRWLCLVTRAGAEVCTAHLSTRSPVEAPANDGQCAELATILAPETAVRAVIFGGDVNRRASCAPAGFWTRTDVSAVKIPGLQQVYGSRGLHAPAAEVVPFTHSDHEVLLVRAHLER